jgi:hypothetical protein
MSLSDLNTYSLTNAVSSIEHDMYVPEPPATGIELVILTWQAVSTLGDVSGQGLEIVYDISQLPIEMRTNGMALNRAVGHPTVTIVDNGNYTYTVTGIHSVEDYIAAGAFIFPLRDYYNETAYPYSAVITNLDYPSYPQTVNGTITILDSPEIGPLVLPDVDLELNACVPIEAPLILDNSVGAGSTYFPERKWTAMNGAHLSTAQKKYGTASLNLDGVNDYIYRDISSDPKLTETAQWTIEFWFRADTFKVWDDNNQNNQARGVLFKTGALADDNNHVAITCHNYNSYTRIKLRTRLNGILLEYGNFQLNTNTWYHLAMTYDGINYRMYLDGNWLTTQESGFDIDYSDIVSIGGDYWNANSYAFFDGYIDDLRVSNIDRYPNETESNNPGDNLFTPPSAHSLDDNTLLLLSFDGANNATNIYEVVEEETWTNPPPYELPFEIINEGKYHYHIATTDNWTSLYLVTYSDSALTSKTWGPISVSNRDGELLLVGDRDEINDHIETLHACVFRPANSGYVSTATVYPNVSYSYGDGGIEVRDFNIKYGGYNFKTVEFWFSAVGSPRTINVLLESVLETGQMRLVVEDRYVKLMAFDIGPEYTYIQSDDQINVNWPGPEWHHVALQLGPPNSGYMTLWLNGEQVLNGYNYQTNTPITNGRMPIDPEHNGWQIGEEYGSVNNEGSWFTLDKFRASNIIRYESSEDFVNGQLTNTPTPFEPDYNTVLYFEFDGNLTNTIEGIGVASTGQFTYTVTNPYSQQTSRTTQEYNL